MNSKLIYNDRQLLQRIAEGNQKAFDLLFERYRDRLFHYLFKITKSRETAEEMVLDVFVKIWQKKTLTEVDHFEAFLFRVARNKAVDYLRSVQRDKRRRAALWNAIQEREATETADGNILLTEFGEAMQQAIEQLSPQRKKVFQLSREGGLSYKQIARKLNLSTHTVRNHIAASLRSIKAHLETESFWYLLLLIYFFPLH